MLGLHVKILQETVGRVLNVHLNDREWRYTSQIAVQMIVNCQAGKPHP